MVHYAKPANEKAFRAEYWNGVGWRVVDRNGSPVGEIYPSKHLATTNAGAKNKIASVAAKRSDRPCMCCRTIFPSEGIHNRLCPRCRNAGSAEAIPAGFGSMSGRKRSA